MILILTALHLFAGLFNFNSTHVKGNFDMNVRCQAAYHAMLMCQFVKADSLLNAERIANPTNLIPDYIANYKDYIIISFNENKNDFEAWKSHEDLRIERLGGGDETSPYYLFTQAEVSLQWALINLKYENYTSALFGVKRAFNYLTDNKKKFPDFVANDKSLGVLHAMIGAVPESYRWAAKMMGFTGTMEEGFKELKNVLSYGSKHPEFVYTDETRYMYLFLQVLLLNDKEGALKTTQAADFPSKVNNPIACFIKGYINMKNFKNDDAISFFKYNHDINRTIFHFNTYLLGVTTLNKLDTTARQYFSEFTTKFKGNNYVKDAFHKMAWCELLKGNNNGYFSALEKIKTRGTTLSDSDKSAQHIAEAKTIPNITLLKARLLMDGGYYSLAIKQLVGKAASDFSNINEKVEFTYRAGRIYQLMGNNEKAMAFFKETISRGSKLPIYYAASAALESGNISEQQKDYAKAKLYFQQCIDMPSSDFKNSIDIKAKAGLQRVSGK